VVKESTYESLYFYCEHGLDKAGLVIYPASEKEPIKRISKRHADNVAIIEESIMKFEVYHIKTGRKPL